jgi:hypothetical protein
MQTLMKRMHFAALWFSGALTIAQATCLQVTCRPNKIVPCTTAWTFDQPVVSSVV